MRSNITDIWDEVKTKSKAIDKGRLLYTAFVLPTAMTLRPTTVFAANDTIWTTASEIM